MTPEGFAAWVGGAGAVLGLLIKAGERIGSAMARGATERRVDLTTIITRQDEEIKRLRDDLEHEQQECDRRTSDLERRARDAERRVTIMEGVLYRMGWEQGEDGIWTHRGRPPRDNPPRSKGAEP